MISITKRVGLTLGEVVSRLNKYSSPSLAESWDNVGLLVEPSPPHVINNVLLTNDLTEGVLEEALTKEINFILSYHPPIFTPMKRLTQNTAKERIIVKCIESRIAVYSPHTSYDAMEKGVNDWLLEPFGECTSSPLKQTIAKSHLTKGGFRVDINCDKDTALQLQLDLTATSGIVSYQCFETHLDVEEESKLSVVCDDSGLLNVLNFLKTYEESVKSNTEVIQLEKPPLPGVGSGRLAILKTKLSVQEVVDLIKHHLDLQHVRLALGRNKEMSSDISTIAVCAGSGSSVLRGVKADLYLTGEMSHHEVLEAVSRKTSVILCDHSNTERGFLHVLKPRLSELFDNEVKVMVSEVDRDPLAVV